MDGQQRDFYQRLRKNLRRFLGSQKGARHRFADVLLFAPDLFHLLCRLTLDPKVPLSAKARVVAAIVYFMSPIDLMPELVLGPIGFADDVVLSAMVVNGVLAHAGEDRIRAHWAGDDDVLDVIRHILDGAEALVGARACRRLRQRARGK